MDMSHEGNAAIRAPRASVSRGRQSRPLPTPGSEAGPAAALLECEQRYRALMTIAPTLVLRVSRDGTYLDYIPPPLFPKLSSARAVLGRTVRQILPAAAAAKRMAAIERAFATGRPQRIRYRLAVRGAVRLREERLTVSGIDEVLIVVRDTTEHRRAEATARNLEDKLHSVLQNVPALIMTMSLDGTLSFVNRTAPGIRAEDLIGSSVFEQMPPEARPAMRAAIQRAVTTGRSGTFEVVANGARRGTLRRYVCRIGLLKRGGGDAALTLVATDVTARERVVDALRESEERYRGLVEGSRDAIFITTVDGSVVDFNQAALTMFGYGKDELPRINVTRLYRDPAERDRFKAAIEGAGSVRDYDLKLQRRDGTPLDCQLTGTVRRSRNGAILGYQGILRDVTQRRRLEREMLDIAEREQRRIGQDLHDGLGQHLTGVAFLSKVLTQKLSSRGAPEAGDAAKIERLMGEAIGQTRTLAKGLQPVSLDVGGLAVALRDLCRVIEDVFGLPCTCELCGEIHVQNTSVATNVYHIAREAVNNAVKHSGASGIVIELCSEGEIATLAVHDDGVGVRGRPKDGDGLGLEIMRYRAEMIGGTLDIEQNPTGGTTVRCTFPIVDSGRG